jgi:ankyrin repeat protein
MGSVEIVDALLKAGADPDNTEDIPGMIGLTPLHMITEMGNIRVVVALLDADAEVDPETSTATQPLHQAAMNGHTEVVKILLDHGADINAQDDNG